MTTEQFAETIDNLINLVLPPSCNDDPPIVAERIIEILEDHIDAIRGTIIRHRTGEQDARETEGA